MKMMHWLVAATLVAACGGGTGDTDDEGSTTAGTMAEAEGTMTPTTSGGDDDPQNPPEGREAVEAWLAAGHYKTWACEAAPHGPIMISPHGMQRICSNDVLSAHPDDGGEYPVGASGVKELYDEAGANIVGYAVYRHTKAGTTGDTWYWYERVPADHPAPHDENGVVADGDGGSGPAMTICVSCHSATGIDADHPGHDFVYTQIK